MKMFIVLTLLTLSVTNSIYSQSAKISMQFEDARLGDVLSYIEHETEFVFFYRHGAIDNNVKVNIHVIEKNIYDVLNEVFRGTDIDYSVRDRLIILGQKDKEMSGIIVQHTITGTVTDDVGEPMSGVNILVKGSFIGVVTDANGKYSIAVPNKEAVLVFTFVGYSQQEVLVGDRSRIDLSLVEDLKLIDEVVVVGYGIQKKSVITGAISHIPMNMVKPVATQRVDQMLQGQAAGMLVQNTDGAPGSETTIRIRGINSIRGGNSALIVIDGFQGGELRSINPNDIASIEVLKDAAATAIYGAQGANGVILITTKRGTTDKPFINYSSELGRSKILMGGIKLMNAAEYARELNMLEMAQDLDKVPQPLFTDDEIAAFEKSGGTDWMKEVYRPAFVQTHQLSVGGKTKNSNYFISGSVLDQDGIMLNSGYNRYSLRSNVGANITDWLSITLNWDGAIQNRYGADYGSGIDWSSNPVQGALIFSPTIPVYDEDGNYSRANNRIGDPSIWNPVASAKEVVNDRRIIHNNINFTIDFKIHQHFTLQINGGARILQNETQKFLNTKTLIGNQNNGLGGTFNSYTKNLQSSNVLTYLQDFGLHNVSFTAVGEIKVSDNYWSIIENSQYTTQATGIYDLNSASIQRTTSGQGHRKILSGVGRLNYAYDSKYMLSMSIRADGSSVFGVNNKWGYFPAASVGWKLSRESFMERTSVWLDDLLIRASLGTTGNQAIGNFQTISQIGSSGRYPWNGGTGIVTGYAVNSASNPNLKWESTRQYNIGVNFSIYKGVLQFTAEYYDKVTSNLLMSRELPKSTGLGSIIDNVGKMGNRGWEFSANGNLRFNDLTWKPGVNATFSKTTVLDLGDDKFLSYSAGGSGHSTNIPFLFLRVGEPFGQIMGFGYEGTWKLGEEEQAGRYGQMPGNPKYTDVNNDGYIDYDNDWKVIGNTLPKMVFGITNAFNYKNFDATFLFQGVTGNKLFNVARIKRETEVGSGTAKFDRWTPDNQNTDVPALFKKLTRMNIEKIGKQLIPVFLQVQLHFLLMEVISIRAGWRTDPISD